MLHVKFEIYGCIGYREKVIKMNLKAGVDVNCARKTGRLCRTLLKQVRHRRSGYSPGGHVNKTYLPGSRGYSEPSSDVEKHFYFLIWRLKSPNQKIKNAFKR